jgi:TRAP-type mannitol/chloroaromatic compound transport system substrate-binding protein
MERREFLKKATIGAGAVVAASAINAPAVLAQKTYKWKMVTTWPPKLPVLQDGAERLAKLIELNTGGRIKIQVFAAGELVPAMGTFDAVSAGTVECGVGAGYYWAGKVPAAQWFSAVPFGLNADGMAAWFHAADGLKLWEETYAPFNVIPRPGGSTGVQMGGWFRKKIESINDFKGLKMRIPGLGGKVVAKAGATVVLTPGGEIFTNLERGVIDATEWVGPLHDLRMGFYNAAKYYYYPGWHEPGTYLEYMFNKKVYDALPNDLKGIIDSTCRDNELWTLAQFNAQNGAALQTLIEKHHVELMQFPKSVMDDLRKLSEQVVAEEAKKDAMSTKVNDSFQKFRKVIGPWGEVSEKAYYNDIEKDYPLKAAG